MVILVIVRILLFLADMFINLPVISSLLGFISGFATSLSEFCGLAPGWVFAGITTIGVIEGTLYVRGFIKVV